MAGTGMFPSFGDSPHDFVRHIRFKSFLSGETTGKKRTLLESSGSPVQLILFLGTMVFATLFFNRLGYPRRLFPFDVGSFENLGDETVGSKHSDIRGDVSRFLFCICSMA